MNWLQNEVGETMFWWADDELISGFGRQMSVYESNSRDSQLSWSKQNHWFTRDGTFREHLWSTFAYLEVRNISTRKYFLVPKVTNFSSLFVVKQKSIFQPDIYPTYIQIFRYLSLMPRLEKNQCAFFLWFSSFFHLAGLLAGIFQ